MSTHSTTSHAGEHSGHHIGSVGMYLAVFLSLIVGTVVTYLVSFVNMGFLNTPVALVIAVTKASLVVMFFMGVRWNNALTKVVAVSGFIWLMILFGLGMSDYISRTWLGVPGR
jgi:cytochrome c oxidase subunit 4